MIRQFARDFLRAFAGEAQGLLAPNIGIEIVEQDEGRLVTLSERRQVVVDKRFGTVKCGAKVLASFDAIQSIDLQHQRGDDGSEAWNVSLYLSWYARAQIGRTGDATEASIVAAHLSTITGRKVLAL